MPLTHSTPFDKFVKEYLNTWAVQHVPVVGYRIIRVYYQVSFQGFLGLKIIRFFYHFIKFFFWHRIKPLPCLPAREGML